MAYSFDMGTDDRTVIAIVKLTQVNETLVEATFEIIKEVSNNETN